MVHQNQNVNQSKKKQENKNSFATKQMRMVINHDDEKC